MADYTPKTLVLSKDGNTYTYNMDMSGKLDVDQGSANAGKIMQVGADGSLSPQKIEASGTYYGTCATAAATQQKVVTLVGEGPSELKEGMVFIIKFTAADSYNGKPTLKIGDFAAVTVNNGYRYMWNANSTIVFVYTNSVFEAQTYAAASTTYYGVTKLTSATNSTSEALGATAKGVKLAYDEAVKVMTGASGSSGAAGRVPAPTSGDVEKYLKGDGTWEVAPGARIIQVTTTVTNTSGSYTTTIQDSRVSADMKALSIEIANPYVFNDKITVTCDTGTVTLSCNDVEGTSDVTVNIIKAALNTATLTTEEFDILNADKVSKDELEEALATIGTGVYVVTLDAVTNTSGSYTHTTTVSGMTGDLKCVKLECSNPTIFRAPVSIVTGTDSVTLSCSSVAGTSTVKASFLAVGNGNPLNSSEYAALDTRIGSLSELETTDKSSVVDAINEVNGNLSNAAYTSGSMNDLPNGTYRIYAAATEKPEANNGYASCIYRADGTKLQYFVSDSNKAYTRIKQNDTWGSWNGLATDSELSSMSAGNYQSGTLTLSVKKYPAIFFFKGDGNNYTGAVAILGASRMINLVTPTGFTVSLSNGTLSCGSGYFYWGIIY